jgi:voltage-gated potassium channel
MLKFILIGAGLVAITVVSHAIGTMGWVRIVAKGSNAGDEIWQPHNPLRLLTGTALVLVVLHSLQIVAWAITYMYCLPSGVLDTFEEAVYFSFVTFTTLGYGDITLSEGWRILSGIEAMNGILLVGWSTAVLFAVVQRTWQGVSKQESA